MFRTYGSKFSTLWLSISVKKKFSEIPRVMVIPVASHAAVGGTRRSANLAPRIDPTGGSISSNNKFKFKCVRLRKEIYIKHKIF